MNAIPCVGSIVMVSDTYTYLVTDEPRFVGIEGNPVIAVLESPSTDIPPRRYVIKRFDNVLWGQKDVL